MAVTFAYMTPCMIALQYLRGVIVSGYQNGTMPHDTPLFPVLARLLKFTDAEVDAINQVMELG